MFRCYNIGGVALHALLCDLELQWFLTALGLNGFFQASKERGTRIQMWDK